MQRAVGEMEEGRGDRVNWVAQVIAEMKSKSSAGQGSIGAANVLTCPTVAESCWQLQNINIRWTGQGGIVNVFEPFCSIKI